MQQTHSFERDSNTNQVLAAIDGTGRRTEYEYDTSGNLTSDGVNSYSWDARDQLISITGPGLSASFSYDAVGRRISKTVNSTTTGYLYDGEDAVQEQAGGTPSANMLVGGIDEVLVRSDASGAVTPLGDALGSVVALANSSGTVETEYGYEPFGKTTVSGEASGNASQYTGRENDGTGLYYYRARYYSPVLQRFISEDPVGFAGGINLFAYVGNNPISFTDPFGLDKNPGGGWADTWFDVADIRAAQGFWYETADEQIQKGNWIGATCADLLNGLIDYAALDSVQEDGEILGSDASAGRKIVAGVDLIRIGASWYFAGSTQITGKIAGQTRTSRIIGLRNKFGKKCYTDEHGFFFAIDSTFHRLHVGRWKGWFKK